jgi:WD40 repeat protein
MRRILLIFLAALAPSREQPAPAPTLGIFEGQGDIGTVLHTGSAAYDSATKTYTVTGSGENMWAASDDFQFVWKKITATDVSLEAVVALLGSEGEAHRKAALMIRQSLASDSPYADAAIHGSGLTSLQFREAKGAPTHEIESNLSAPARLRIEKRGDSFYMFVSPDANGVPTFAGGSAKIPLTSPFYVGLAVCAHNKNNIQQATFSNVELDTASRASQPLAQFSTIETVTVASTDARVTYVTTDHLKSPNWSAEGAAILFNNAGKLQQIAAAGGSPQAVPGDVPETYGQERSPDGRYIYNSSSRTGSTQIWRTAADGSNAEQLTNDDQNDDYPRLSPDGLQLAFLSYSSSFQVLPSAADVTLRVLSLSERKVRTIAKFTGGPESLSHPWSPDGNRLVFISYQAFAP